MAAIMISSCLAGSNVSAYASSSNVINTEGISGDSNNESTYVPSLEEKQVIEENKQLVEYELKKQQHRSSQGVKVVLDVTAIKQSETWYCAPATVKQTLDYRNGKSSTQKTYATELGTTTSGTDMTQIPTVLNKHLSTKKYAYMDIGTYSNYTASVTAGLQKGNPVVIDIKAKTSDGWKYNTAGHFLNICGMDASIDGTKIQVADPHYNYTGKQWYDAKTVYNVNNAHSRKAFIW